MTHMNKILLDSWAWVEYLRGGERGRKVRSEIERSIGVYTHLVTVAELTSKLKREGIDPEVAWRAVTSISKAVTPNTVDAKNVGLLHAEIKIRRPNFSLADAFVLHGARKLGARVLTGDPDFQGIKEAIMIT